MKPRIARWIAWSIVAVYVILGAIGLTLQLLADNSFTGIPFPVIFIMVVIASVWPVFGALIVSRHPRHPVGWLLSIGVATASIDMFAAGYAFYDVHVHPGSLPGVELALIWLMWSAFPFATTAFTLMFLLFPDGRLPTPRWRNVAWAAVGALFFYLPLKALEPGPVDPNSGIFLLNPIGASASLWATLKPLLWAGYVMLPLCYLIAFISLLLRLRRTQGEERQQIKWLLYPAALYLIDTPVIVLGLALANEQILEIGVVLGLPPIAGIVIATAFAIFKYRLYDIDLIVNRTLVYGALTAIVVAIYVLVVGGFGSLVQSEGNLLISLVATGLIAVLFQPLRQRLQRAVNRLTYGDRDEPFEALARLGRRLEGVFSPEMVYPTIVETVAQALKLPYAAIAVKRGEAFEVVEAYGSAAEDPVAYPLLHQGQAIGRLLVGRRTPGERFSAADERLLQSFARQAGTAVYAVQLTADLRRSRQQLVTAREEERLRLRRDLHDGLGPALASVVWQAESARDLVRTDPSEAAQLLQSSIEQAQAALTDIRRLVYGLRPPALDELGLVGALEQVAGQHGQTAVTIEAPSPLSSLPAAVEVAAYRIVQEALKNAVTHGKARHCIVSLHLDGCLHLAVNDDGLGLPDAPTTGVGLVSMRQRAEELGGVFTVQPRPAGGTEVEVSLPLESS